VAQAGAAYTLATAEPNHDDASADIMLSAACVAMNTPTDVDVNHAIHLLQRGLFERVFGMAVPACSPAHQAAEVGTVFSTAAFTASASQRPP